MKKLIIGLLISSKTTVFAGQLNCIHTLKTSNGLEFQQYRSVEAKGEFGFSIKNGPVNIYGHGEDLNLDERSSHRIQIEIGDDANASLTRLPAFLMGRDKELKYVVNYLPEMNSKIKYLQSILSCRLD